MAHDIMLDPVLHNNIMLLLQYVILMAGFSDADAGGGGGSRHSIAFTHELG